MDHSELSKQAGTNENGGGRPQKLMLKVLAAFFALYAAYCLWVLSLGWNWSAVFSSALGYIAAVGLWFGFQWSRYIVYLFSALIVAYFIWYMWALVQMGWPYRDKVKSFVSLVPGTLLLMLGVGAGIYVFRVFRKGS